jgi:hypothetical protein
MTLLDKLQAHKGGLLQLKPPLYWYGRGGWDNNPGRVCLLLDATCPATAATARASAAATPAAAARRVAAAAAARNAHPGAAARRTAEATAAFLLIDGQPHWVWIAEEDVELLVNDPPAN